MKADLYLNKTVIKQVIRYQWVCPKCGHTNSNKVDDFNVCKKCNEEINDFEYKEEE